MISHFVSSNDTGVNIVDLEEGPNQECVYNLTTSCFSQERPDTSSAKDRTNY